jgi:hypothetical protein
MACEVMLLLERLETEAVRVRREVGTVRNEDNDENSFACLEDEANKHLIQSVRDRSVYRISEPVDLLVELSIPSAIALLCKSP